MYPALLFLSLLQSAQGPAPIEIDECDARYFGVTGAADLKAAYACYQQRQRWVMVALMRLNGEGTGADPKAAEAALRTAGNRDAADEAQALANIIRRRTSQPGEARVDFCNDVAQSQAALDRCAAIGNRLQGQAVARTLASLRAQLTPTQQPALEAVAAALDALAVADGDRLWQQYVEGAVKESAAQKQQALVRRNFAEFLRLWLVERQDIPPADKKLAELERAAEATYRRNLDAYLEAYGPRKGIPDDVAAAHKGYLAEYRRKSNAAKQAWVRYRDAWGKLLAAVNSGPKSATSKHNARVQLTARRLLELSTDPFDQN